MKTVLDARPHIEDPALVPIPWRDDVLYLTRDGKRRLKVGVMWDDGVVKPHPPII